MNKLIHQLTGKASKKTSQIVNTMANHISPNHPLPLVDNIKYIKAYGADKAICIQQSFLCLFWGLTLPICPPSGIPNWAIKTPQSRTGKFGYDTPEVENIWLGYRGAGRNVPILSSGVQFIFPKKRIPGPSCSCLLWSIGFNILGQDKLCHKGKLSISIFREFRMSCTWVTVWKYLRIQIYVGGC